MEKVNLVLSPSQQKHNICKAGDTENVHCRAIGQKIISILSEFDIFNLYLIPQFSYIADLDNLYAAIKESNRFIAENGGKGFHVGIHSDAGGGKGASGLYVSDAGKVLASNILTPLMALTPWNDVGLRHRTGLAELNKTSAIAAIIEVSFHDDITQATWIHNHCPDIANAICDGIFSTLVNVNDAAYLQALIDIDQLIHSTLSPSKGVH